MRVRALNVSRALTVSRKLFQGLVASAALSAVAISSVQAATLLLASQDTFDRPTSVGGGDRFGESVAASVDRAVVGAPSPSVSGEGAAYVYTRTGPSWAIDAVLAPPTMEPGDNFGSEVAISQDGNVVLVGAPLRDADTQGSADDSGAGYIFERQGDGSWALLATLLADAPVPEARLGVSVALSADGQTAVLGATRDDVLGTTSAGSVYVFSRGNNDFQGAPQKLDAGANAGDTFAFGASVDLSVDELVVGAPLDSASGLSGSGAAYVFRRTAGTWNLLQQLVASDPAEADFFGASVSVSENGLLVGAPRVEASGESSVFDSGAAYGFVKSQGNWSQSIQFLPALPAQENFFGIQVDTNGGLALIGGHGTEVVAAQLSDEQWQQLPGEASLRINSTNSQFGASAAVAQSQVLIIGAPAQDFNRGNAYFVVTSPPRVPLLAGKLGTFALATAIAIFGMTGVSGRRSRRKKNASNPQ